MNPAYMPPKDAASRILRSQNQSSPQISRDCNSGLTGGNRYFRDVALAGLLKKTNVPLVVDITMSFAPSLFTSITWT